MSPVISITLCTAASEEIAGPAPERLARAGVPAISVRAVSADADAAAVAIKP
jgi:hypothetical protein